MAAGLTGASAGSIDVLLNVDRKTAACAGANGVDLPSSTWTTDRDVQLQPGAAPWRWLQQAPTSQAAASSDMWAAHCAQAASGRSYATTARSIRPPWRR